MFDLVEKATVRDGLVNLLEGGYNVITATDFPTTLDLELIASVELDVDDQMDEYTIDLRITLTCDDGEPTDIEDFRRKGRLTRRDSSGSNSGAIVLPFVVDTSMMDVPRPGAYRFTLWDHEEQVGQIRFFAEQAERQE